MRRGAPAVGGKANTWLVVLLGILGGSVLLCRFSCGALASGLRRRERIRRRLGPLDLHHHRSNPANEVRGRGLEWRFRDQPKIRDSAKNLLEKQTKLQTREVGTEAEVRPEPEREVGRRIAPEVEPLRGRGRYSD